MVFNLSVCIETTDRELQGHLDEFIEENFKEVGMAFSRDQEPEVKYYVGKVTNRPIYLFTTDQFRFFNFYLRKIGYQFKDYEVDDQRNYESFEEDYKMRVDWPFKDGQQEAFDFLLERPSGNKLLPLVMGSGKTYLAALMMSKIKKRTALVVDGITFMEKWCGDFKELHYAEDSDICVIQGKASIQALAEQAKVGRTRWKYYIFSLPTYRSFIKVFEEDPSRCLHEFGCTPLDLFPLLGVEILIVDEAHLSFHALFRMIIYSNVRYQLNLSATLIPSTDAEARAQRSLLGPDDIYGDKMIRKYTDFVALDYNIAPFWLQKLRWTNSRGNRGMYSHSKFEESLMKDKKILAAFLKMVGDIVEMMFVDKMVAGQKAMIFFYTVKMTEYATEYFQLRWPNLKAAKFTADNKLSEIEDPTVTFILTTPGSAGTGIDIKYLAYVLNTVSISSEKLNLQIAGRLRELKDMDTTFSYLYSSKIDKQANHHEVRTKQFEPIAATYQHMRVPNGLFPIQQKHKAA